MDDKTISVLLIEDNPGDARLIREMLTEARGVLFHLECADRLSTGLERLAQGDIDVVLLDLGLPESQGLDTCARVHTQAPEVPIVVLTGLDDEALAVQAVEAGAQDYLVKGQVDSNPLVRALRYAIERKRTGEALRESEERFRQFFENEPEYCYMISPEGVILDVNRAALKALGYKKEELVGKSLQTVYAPESLPKMKQLLAKWKETGELEDEEMVIVTKDGNRRTVLLSSGAVRDKDGKILHSVSVQRDITQRKQAEEALRKSEERFRTIVETAPSLLLITDAKGNNLYVSPNCEEITGYTQEELQGRVVWWVHEDDTPRGKEIYDRTFREGVGSRGFEYKAVKKNGELWYGSSSWEPLRDAEGRLQGVVFQTTDITARKRAERLLQALNQAALAMGQALTTEEIFTTVAEELKKLGFHCAIYLEDESQSKLFIKYFSYDAKAIKAAEKLADLMVEGVSISIEDSDVYRETVRGKKTVFVENIADVVRQWLPKPARRFALQITRMLRIPKSVAAPLIVEDEVIGVLSVQSDDLTQDDIPAITAFAHQVSAAWHKAQLLQDLQNSLEELKETQDQLVQAQKMEAVGRLTGGIAHDFNNLLTVITGFSELVLRRHLDEGDPLYKPIEEIKKAGQRAAALTGRLLAFSRKQVLQSRVLDLNTLVTNAEKMLRRIIGEDIDLVTVLKPGLGHVKADPGQIEQVIVNLAVNAHDAMPQGGQLTIETADVELDETYARRHASVEPGPYVMLAVSDTGIGMDEETQSHIFEPFFTTKEQGTGLGLSTVYGIVKQSGGHIWVYSELGRGTAFKVYLPRVEEAVEPLEPSVAPTKRLQGSETILVVEDDQGVRLLARAVLEMDGYTVLEACHGEEALQVCKGHEGPIHLMVTDVVMPQMSGRELAERLAPLHPEMKVLYMSGYTDKAIVRHGVLEPGLTFLQKPFTPGALARKVRQVLDGPHTVIGKQ